MSSLDPWAKFFLAIHPPYVHILHKMSRVVVVALRQQEARLRDQERKMKEQEETHLSQEKKLKARMDEERKALKRREEEKAKEMLRLEQVCH